MFTAATRFLSSLQGMLHPLYEDTLPLGFQIDDIREAMLKCLDAESARRFPQMERRILMAANVPALWFLRPELLMVLAVHSGEQAAHRVVDEISAMFDGLLPKGLTARPSRPQR